MSDLTEFERQVIEANRKAAKEQARRQVVPGQPYTRRPIPGDPDGRHTYDAPKSEKA